MKTQNEILGKSGCSEGEAMPQTKIDAFLRQFHWVEKYVKEPIRQVYVTGVDDEVLNRAPCQVVTGDNICGTDKYQERLFLLDENFDLVAMEKVAFTLKLPLGIRIHLAIKSKRASTCSLYVLAIRLGEDARSVKLVLSHFDYTGAVILYKMPKNTSLADLVGKLSKKMDQQINAEQAIIERAFESI